MRMWKNIVITLAILISLYSCSNDHSLDVLTFDTSVELTTERIATVKPKITYPYDMFVTENYIYVLSLCYHKWLHCYDRFTGVYINSFIDRGRGPGELLTCIDLLYDNESGIVYLYDRDLEKMLSLKVSEEHPDLSLVEENNYTEIDSAFFRQMWPFADSKIITNSQFGELEDALGRFQLYTMAGVQIHTCDDVPDLRGDDIYTYLQSSVTISPDQSHMASMTLFGEILEIYNLSEKAIIKKVEKIYSAPNIIFKDGTIWGTDATVYGFPFSTSDNSYIYASMANDKNPNNFNKIVVFDWNGNGILKITTDYNVLRMALYEGDIYAIVLNAENELFFACYKIKDLIEG